MTQVLLHRSAQQWHLSRRHHSIYVKLVSFSRASQVVIGRLDMSSVLQQTLRDLCFDTGWCYAVFWKLKQRPRPVLTWEDAFYGCKMEDINAAPSVTITPSFGQQFCGGLTDMDDPIGLSVSKMSYHVYSVGEGIIGRVAFTNKHQWVFSSSDKGTAVNGVPSRKANPRMQPEKYPSGWEHQFTAGIKTIAVIAVPQGVVQLGSTRMIVEDLKLIAHVKALFGTLQNVPGAFLSDIVSEVQKGGAHTVYPLAVPVHHLLPSRDPVLMNVQSPTVAKPSLPANMSLAVAGAATYNSNLGCSGVGRLPMMLASQHILPHAHSWPLPLPIAGFQENVSHIQHRLLDKPGLESTFPFFKPSWSWAGPLDKIGTSQSGVVKPTSVTAPTLSTDGLKANPPPRTGITRHLSLSSKASSIALPVSKVPSSEAGQSSVSADCSLTGGKTVCAPMVESSKYLIAHGQSGAVSRTKGPSPFNGNKLTDELFDIPSSVRSQKTIIRTTKENLSCVAGTPGRGSTPSLHCEELVKSRQLVGVRPAAEQSLPVQEGSGRHFGKCQQRRSSRSSTESEQLNPPFVAAVQLDWGSHVTEKGPDIADNWPAGESRQLISPSPSSLDRPSIQNGQYFDKPKHLFAKSGQFGGAKIVTEKFQSVSERSSVESSQPGDDISPISIISGGLSTHLERCTSSITKQESSCMSEFLSMGPETSPLQCEQSSHFFATEMAGEISDLLQLVNHFENADKDDYKNLSCDRVDLHQSISSSLLCDDYFENVEFNAWDSGLADNSIENLFTNELNDFDEFFARFTNTEKSSSETSPEPVLFARKTDNLVSISLSNQDHGGFTEGMEHSGKHTIGLNVLPCQFATAQPVCEPALLTFDSDQPFSHCFAKEVTFSCEEFPSIQSEPRFDRFVNSRTHPQVVFPSFRSTDGNTEPDCQDMAALPPASRPPKTVRQGKKRFRAGENDIVQSKDRQRIQECIQELRAIVPDGARKAV